MASPLKAYGAAADPTVRAGANGLFYYSGIAFNRGTNIGAVFVSRFFDQNNKENGDATQGRDTIALPRHEARRHAAPPGSSSTSPGSPWTSPGAARAPTTCSFTPPGGTAQSFVGGNVYMTWSRFTGKHQHARSCSRGRSTAGRPGAIRSRLSEANSINQGTNIAVDPTNGTVYVAWRRFATSSQPDAIVVAKSTDFGQTLPSKNTVQVATISPLDQGTSGTRFRTNALPTIAVSVDSANNVSRVHVAWAQRSTHEPATPGSSSRRSTDGLTWGAPVARRHGASRTTSAPSSPAATSSCRS